MSDPDFVKKALGKEPNSLFRIAAIDPGETTGYVVFEGPNLVQCGQFKAEESYLGAVMIRDRLVLDKVDQVVMENYLVYSWKAKDHAWGSLFTPQLIGALRLVCHDMKLPVKLQMAQQAKGFVTDDRLKEWGYYVAGERHSRDAMRHALYFLLFDLAKVHQHG